MNNLTQSDQKKPKMKKGKKIMMILGIIAAVIIASMIVGLILQTTYFKTKYNIIEPYGQLIDVDGGHMHLYSMGNGDKTIVLLPGMGVALPSAEFAPLMRTLSQKYTVVSVEYFGQGFSSETDKPRNCENYVEETKEALSKAGFKAPYILMPHSISGIYSEYYAATYPEEIEAIISLDGTPTVVYEKLPAIFRSILSIAKFQQAIGTTSIMAPLALNKAQLSEEGYTNKEIKDLISFMGFSMNNTVIDQISNSAEFIKQTLELPFPESVAYFKIISKTTYETPNPQLKKFKLTPQDFQHRHLERIGTHAQYEILEGSHYIYKNNAKRILEITDQVLQNTDQ